jgi:hypothetical protein
MVEPSTAASRPVIVERPAPGKRTVTDVGRLLMPRSLPEPRSRDAER